MKTKKNYRLFIFIILLFILQGCSQPTKNLNTEVKIKSGKDISFYIATDIHYLSKALTDNGEAFNKFVSTGAGKQIGYMEEILGAFTYEVKNKRPDILIISGDLTNNRKSYLFRGNCANIKTNRCIDFV